MNLDNNRAAALGFRTPGEMRFPNIVNVEVYRSQCPCRCDHCPVGRTPPAERRSRFGEIGMQLSLYDKIVDELAAYPGRMLRIHSVGEPLLWPDLASALRRSSEQGVRTWVFTSAVTRDRKLLAILSEYADIVEVSLNSIDRSDYLATKGVDAFDLVMENLAFLRGRTDRGALTRLLVSRVQSPDPAADEAFVRYWAGATLVDDAFVRSFHTYNDLLSELPGGEQRPPPHEACLVHWARFNISVGGAAVICFNELFKERLDPSFVLGDVNGQSIAEIWRGPALAALRRAELSGDYSALPMADSLPCRTCRSCQPLRGKRVTSEHQIKQLT